jgi:hypothetical protein
MRDCAEFRDKRPEQSSGDVPCGRRLTAVKPRSPAAACYPRESLIPALLRDEGIYRDHDTYQDRGDHCHAPDRFARQSDIE